MTVIEGIESLSRLNELSEYFRDKNVMVVTGKNSFEKCGAKNVLDIELKSQNVVYFSEFSVNPKLEDAQSGAKIARAAKANVIIAVGGGSVIDMAKLIKAFFLLEGKEEAVAKGIIPVNDPKIPLIAIPTTAGSGSEATHFAVVYVGDNKYSLAAQCLLPTAVILDGSLVSTLSDYQKACNALDVLSQGIESFWARSCTFQSINYSNQAIVQCIETLSEGDSILSNQKMMLASHFAGRAINISKTTSAHAWSYAFTSRHGIPHGHAVWLTLPAIFQIHFNRSKKEKSDLENIMSRLVNLLSLNYEKCLSSQIKLMLSKLNIEHCFEKLGICEEERYIISNLVNSERMKNNPVTFSQVEINQIFCLSGSS